MSVIFDAPQNNGQLTNQVKIQVISDGIIILDEGITKNTVFLSFIALLTIVQIIWFFSNVISSISTTIQLGIIETIKKPLTITDIVKSLLLYAEKFHPEIAGIKVNKNQENFDYTHAVDPVNKDSTLQQPAVPVVMIVNSKHESSYNYTLRKQLSFNEMEPITVPEGKISLYESKIIVSNETQNQMLHLKSLLIVMIRNQMLSFS